MTALQETPIYYVDSPLTSPHPEPDYGWADVARRAHDPMAAVQRRMMVVLSAAVLFVVAFGSWAVRTSAIGSAVDAVPTAEVAAEEQPPAEVAVVPAGSIAPLFTREIQHWAPQIVAWAAAQGLDPNMAATVMQIESCGDPNAVSSAGAQGLFQVMPFHFDAGENMQDPDTNARRGMAYLAQGMQLTGGDTGLSFAGYNGGHGTAAKGWSALPNETQRYYTWATGIYKDAVAGSSSSETLNQWLAAGGAGLCAQASARLGLQ